MHPNRPIAVNPIWQSSAVVYLLIVFATIAEATKGLGVPYETGAAPVNRFNMIHSEVIERKLNITSEAMEIIELAKVIPFNGGVRAARLGFADAANTITFPLRLLAPFGLKISAASLFVFVRLLVLSPILFTPFGLLILLLAYFTLTLEPISFAPVPKKPFSRFDLAALTTSLHHFVVSLFFQYLNYTTVKGGT